jgi:hypothetical protein
MHSIHNLYISENKKEKEIDIVKQIAMDNGYPQEIINCFNDHTLRQKITSTRYNKQKMGNFYRLQPKIEENN